MASMKQQLKVMEESEGLLYSHLIEILKGKSSQEEGEENIVYTLKLQTNGPRGHKWF